MRVLKREFFNISRSTTYRLVPIGDIHLGAAACDEKRLRQVVHNIAEDETAFWVGMGDYCDFINRSDPRFSPATLSSWITIADLADLARAQRDRFLDIIKPIAHKCWAMVEGNHETAITRHYERAIFNEIACGVKRLGRFGETHKLSLGYGGWLKLHFYRSNKKSRASIIKINLHHGFTGGRLAGAKALNMQRWLWSHDCDIAIFGHSHNTATQVEAVEVLVGDRAIHKPRYGLYAGTFLDTHAEGASTYAEIKGYLPMPNTGCEIILRPGAKHEQDKIRIVTI